MQRSTFCMLLMAGLLSAGIGPALADNGVYVSGSVGQSEVRFDASNLNASANNVGYQAGLGFRPFGVLAAELDYASFPRAYSGINYVDTYGLGASILGFLPVPLVDVYGRLGVFSARTNATTTVNSYNHSGSDLTYGVGVGAHWGRIGARLEYEAFNVAHAETLHMVSAGVVWTIF